jgi:hypothetical protein
MWKDSKEGRQVFFDYAHSEHPWRAIDVQVKNASITVSETAE